MSEIMIELKVVIDVMMSENVMDDEILRPVGAPGSSRWIFKLALPLL